jgi:hypothetical protein
MEMNSGLPDRAQSGLAALGEQCAELDHDPIGLNRIMISSLCLSMTFSENRFPLFRVVP